MPESTSTTTIEIKEDTWRELNSRKNPGDSFDDVVRRELGLPQRINYGELAEEHDLTTEEVEAIRETYDYVRERDWVPKQEILDEVWEEYPAGKHAQDGDYWWRDLIVPVLVDGGFLERDSQGRVRVVKG